jgi:MFS family permease
MIKKAFPVLGLSIFSSMLGVGIVAPLLPLYAETMGATGIWVGLIFAAFPISRTLATPVFGQLSDRSGRKPFLCLGLLLFSIISLGFVWADSIYQLVAVRFLHGIAGAMILPIALAFVGDISPEGEEGKWMGFAGAAFFGGFGFGPLMGGVLTEHLGMDIAFFTMCGLNLIAFIIAAIFLPAISSRGVKLDADLSFRRIATSRVMNGLFIIRLAFAIGRGASAAFLPIFAVLYLGLSSSLVGVILAVYILLMSFLGIPAGRIADWFSKRKLVVFGSIITSIYLALIPWTGDFWQIFWVCVFGSLGGALSLPASSALVVEKGREFGMGSAMAFYNMAFSIGMGIGPILVGAIADFADVSAVFYFGAVVMLMGLGMFAWLARQ